MDEQEENVTLRPEGESQEPEVLETRELTDKEKQAAKDALELAARLEREAVAQAEQQKPDKERGITRTKRPAQIVHEHPGGGRPIVQDVVQTVTKLESVPGAVIVSTPHVAKPQPRVQVGHMIHTRNPALQHPDLPALPSLPIDPEA